MRVRQINLNASAQGLTTDIPTSFPLVQNRLPGYVMVGDSTIARGNRHFTATSLTSSGTTATLTFTNHLLTFNSKLMIHNADQAEYNGYFNVTNRVDANNVQFELDSDPAIDTATGTILVYTQNVWNESNWVCMSDALAHGKGLYLGNYAMGGSQTNALDGQLDIALNPTKNLWGSSPNIVFISSGINDVVNDVAYATTIANLTAAINRVTAYGALPVVATLWPLGSSFASWSVARAINARAISQWIRDNVPTLGGMVIDVHDICVDYDSQYGEWATNLSSDFIHPRKRAVFLVAKELKASLWDQLTVTDHRSYTSVGPNPAMAGTTGTETGTGASGDTADGYTLTASGGGSQLGVGAKGIALNGAGESQRIAITGAANADVIELRGANAVTGLVAGDVVFMRCRLRTDQTPTLDGLRHNYLALYTTINASVNAATCAAAFYDNDATQNWGEGFDVVLETPPFEIPTGITNLQTSNHFRFNSAGGPIDFDIAEVDVLKLS